MAKFTTDTLVDTYVQIRAKKQTLEAAHKDAIANLDLKLNAIQTELVRRSQAQGVSSFKTPHGTASIFELVKVSCKNWGALDKFILDNKLPPSEVLEKRVKKDMALAYLKDNGTLPPGVDSHREATVRVTKPKTRS